MNTAEKLKFYFARTEHLTIVAVSGPDVFGNAMAQLSNGSTRYCKMPIVGQNAGRVTHWPKVVPLQDRNGWAVTPYKEETFEIGVEEVQKLFSETREKLRRSK